MALPSAGKKKESPAEPFKTALGLCARAIAGHNDVQVTFAAGRPEIEGHAIQLPESTAKVMLS
jgi:cobaltochelatase CobT